MPDVVSLKVQQRLFVGSYAPVRVMVDPSSGLTVEDLDFVVPDGLAGGLVSTARPTTFDLKQRPEVMLLAGSLPGTYRIDVIERATGATVGQAKFEITDVWDDDRVGPNLWFSGEQATRAFGSAWGGGPSGPQNVGVVPASGTRRVAVLFVDTLSQRYTTDVATMDAHRQRWLDEIVDGVTTAGVVRSSRLFFEEVSFGSFSLSAQAFGPVQLPGNFATYFNDDGSPKGSYYQACFTAGDALINFSNFDTLLCVSQSDLTSTPTRSAWPYASIGAWGPFTTNDGKLNYGVISMPNEWGTTNDREIHETFSHELAHNLGLGDQYTPAVAGRNIGDWDLMHADDPLPHLCLAHRLMLGWAEPAWVRTFNFAAGGAPVDQKLTLSAIENGTPPAGAHAGIEVRIADGLNYYIEYRNGESPQIGDRNLPTDDRVVGTDVASPPFTPPMARPGILLLRTDGTDAGPVLGAGDFYDETDNSNPLFPVDFRLDVESISGGTAEIRLRYGTNGRPDPSIRPWPAGPGRTWQSPDIEVKNAKNAADATWFNVPWAGKPNTIVARIRNAGSVLAPSVRANFFVKNYNIGGAPEAFLGTDVRDIPAGATVEFSTSWVPPATGHFCVIVRIPLYVVPSATTVIEMTELNNVAQSNYDRFNTATSSPSTREVTELEVSNPYDKSTRVFVVANQENPLYRTYIDHTWLWLEPGESRSITVMFEHTLDPRAERLPPDVEHLGEGQIRELRFVPNDVGIYSVIEDPEDAPRHAKEVLGGAQVMVTNGRATKFDKLVAESTTISGRVVAVDDGGPADGLVMLTSDLRDGDPLGFVHTTEALVGGAFRARLPGEWQAVQVEYLPATGFAPCTSEWLRR